MTHLAWRNCWNSSLIKAGQLSDMMNLGRPRPRVANVCLSFSIVVAAKVELVMWHQSIFLMHQQSPAASSPSLVQCIWIQVQGFFEFDRCFRTKHAAFSRSLSSPDYIYIYIRASKDFIDSCLGVSHATL